MVICAANSASVSKLVTDYLYPWAEMAVKAGWTRHLKVLLLNLLCGHCTATTCIREGGGTNTHVHK